MVVKNCMKNINAVVEPQGYIVHCKDDALAQGVFKLAPRMCEHLGGRKEGVVLLVFPRSGGYDKGTVNVVDRHEFVSVWKHCIQEKEGILVF
jgi:hypothetical protein